MFQREEDVTLEMIEYDWVSKCTSVKQLKRALQVLKQDGGHYPELERAVNEKILELNPDSKDKLPNQSVDPQTKKLVEEALYEWENEIKEKSKLRAAGTDPSLDEDTRKKLGDNERNKGNEAIKSGDLKEALQYYTKSIQHYDKSAPSYCNRALVYLKLKDYRSCISDCDKALRLDPKYSKAFHRRAKSHLQLGNHEQAIKDFQEVMKLEPTNSEVNAELMEARKKFGEPSAKKTEFKRITIEEDSEEDDEDDDKENNTSAGQKQNASDEKINKFFEGMSAEDQKKEVDQKLKKGEELKEKAKELLQTGKYELAIDHYQKGLNILNEIQVAGVPEELRPDFPNKKAVLFNNISYCYMQMDLPDNVIAFTSRVLGLNEVASEHVVKAQLRRALAYEKIDKIYLALRDYEGVKHLNPSDMTASEGLSRLHKLISKDEDLKKSVEKERSKEAAKSLKQDISAEIASYEEQKTQGNAFFKAQNFAGAKEKFFQVQTAIEERLGDKALTAENKSSLEKLYIQVTSNAAMCCFNLNEIDLSMKNCEKVLKIEPDHQKCLYRKALCLQKIGEQIDQQTNLVEIERKKKQLVYYDEARKIWENILNVDKKNVEVKNKVSDLIRTIVNIRIKYKLVEEKPTPAKVEVVEESKQQAEETTSNSPKKANKNPAKGVTKEFLDNVTQNAAKTVTEQLISSKDLPQTSTAFETDIKAFKNATDKLYYFIKKIPVDHFVGLYKQKSFSTELLLTVIESIKVSGLRDDSKYCFQLLSGITQTHRFDLLVKQLIAKEKKEIQSVLTEIQNNQGASETEIKELTDKYIIKK